MSQKTYGIRLTFKDDTVPDDYISIYEIFTNPKCVPPLFEKEEWCIGEKRLHEMRKQTFDAVKKRFNMCNVQDYAKFWNCNLDAINDLGLNKFANMLKFKELATAMICFQDTLQKGNNITKYKYVSFGIKKSIFRAYYDSQQKALETGTEPQKVNMYDNKKKRSGNLYKESEVKIKFNETEPPSILTLEKNAVYLRFEHWCKLKGIDKKRGMYQAMMFIMQEYPANDLQALGAYEIKTDLDYSEIIVPETSIKDNVGVRCEIPKKIHKQMCEIIKRFNSDPKNIALPNMSINKYTIQAIDLLNQKSPLKYSNPKLYDEYMQALEAQKYNEMMTNKKR